MPHSTTQFYKAAILFTPDPIVANNPVGAPITPFYIPTLPGAQLTFPKNYSIPPIIGNYWQLNYEEGFRNPTMDVMMIPLDVAKGTLVGSGSNATAIVNPLSAQFLNYAHVRTQDAAHDIYPFSKVDFWDGQSGISIAGAKIDSYTISSSKGEDVRVMVRIVGATATALASAPVAPVFTTARVIRFQSVNFATSSTSAAAGTFKPITDLSNKIWSFQLTFRNNCTPDMSLDGTSTPYAQNAGMMDAGLTVMTQAADLDLVATDGNFQAQLTISSQFSKNRGGDATAKAAVFTTGPLLDNTSDTRTISAPRSMRTHQFLIMGGTTKGTGYTQAVAAGTGLSGGDEPIQYSSTF